MHLVKRFKKEQQEGGTQQQHPPMSTIELVKQYHKEADFSQIKSDFLELKSPSTAAQKIQERFNWKVDLLQYAILDIQDALQILSLDREKEVLDKLKKVFELIYENYTTEPNERVRSAFAHLNDFLEIEIKDLSNLKRAKELYAMFYLSLCAIRASSIDLPLWLKYFLGFWKIDIENIKATTDALLIKIENKIGAFDVTPQAEPNIEVSPIPVELESPPSSNNQESEILIQPELVELPSDLEVVEEETSQFIEQKVLTSSQRLLQNYFDPHYLALFIKDVPIKERLKDLHELSQKIKSSLEQLSSLKNKEQATNEQLEQISKLLDIFAVNENRKRGRKYFSDLKNENSHAFTLLLDLSSGEVKSKLLAVIEAQKEDTSSAKLYWLSTAFAPVIFLSRLLPEAPQKPMVSLLPETLDARAKRLTKELAQMALAELKLQLDKINSEKQVQQQISLGDPDLNKLLASESAENLLALADANTLNKDYSELASQLKLESVPVVSVKAEVQNGFQEQYRLLMQGPEDESVKISTLMTKMHSTVNGLNELVALKTEKEALYLKIRQLESLRNVFNLHTDNQLIGPVVNPFLQTLYLQLEELNTEINRLASGLLLTHQQQLSAISIDELNEFIVANRLPESIDATIPILVTEITPLVETLPEDVTSAAYFIKRYHDVVNVDNQLDEQRLAALIDNLTEVEKGIQLLLSARKEYDATDLRMKQVCNLHQSLAQQQANPLLLQILTVRLAELVESNAIAEEKRKVEASRLALGEAAFIQCLLREKPEDLLKINEINIQARKCIEEYKLLKDRIALLEQLTQGTECLENYVTNNYTLWVQLTDLLAQFLAIFKIDIQTDVSKRINQAKEIKIALFKCRAQCEQEISIHSVSIKQDHIVGNKLLGDLAEQYAKSEDSEFEPVDTTKTENLLSQVSLFKPAFKVAENSERENQLHP